MSKPRLKPRQKAILKALEELGGEADMWEIAKKAGLNVNGVSQSLSSPSLAGSIEELRGNPKARIYRLIKK